MYLILWIEDVCVRAVSERREQKKGSIYPYTHQQLTLELDVFLLC